MGMRKAWPLAALLLVLGACASDEGADDAAAGDSMAMDSMMGDSMAGMDHSRMGMTPAKDGQHEFLRAMSDHHEGLVNMAMAAMNQGSTSAVQMEAHMLHTRQAAERDSMVQKIQALYQEQHQPKAMAKNVAQADSLAKLSGPEYDRTFYRMVIEHHREGVAMIDQHLPHLTDPQVKQMAERMKAEQQKEIADFEKKAGGA